MYILAQSPYAQLTSSQTDPTCGSHFEKHCAWLQNSPSAWECTGLTFTMDFWGIWGYLVSLSLLLVKHPNIKDCYTLSQSTASRQGSRMSRAGPPVLRASAAPVNGSGRPGSRADQSAQFHLPGKLADLGRAVALLMYSEWILRFLQELRGRVSFH